MTNTGPPHNAPHDRGERGNCQHDERDAVERAPLDAVGRWTDGDDSAAASGRGRHARIDGEARELGFACTGGARIV